MLKLGGKVSGVQSSENSGSRLYSISTNALLPGVLKESKAYLVQDDKIPDGFAHYLILDSMNGLAASLPKNVDYTLLPDDYAYLGDEDVIRLSQNGGAIRVLFRKSSHSNSILVTERCNHYCLMCSQPPKNVDDSWLLDEIEQLIPLIPRTTREIGFTGGEPTLHGERFLEILRTTKSYLPWTSVHILSNGRRFKEDAFVRSYAGIEHPDMMVGIPIYSDDPALHDFIVQAKGAFDETVQGLLNLKRMEQKVEIRVVIHQQSTKRLSQLCEFLARNLLFVDHVALMGLEMTGFTRANLDKLWIDPYEYKDALSRAVEILASYGMNISVYNHQICLVNEDVRPYYRKSISDWKNEYAPECSGCTMISECGGFFSSAIRHRYSKHLKPFQEIS
ncbi:MAG: His-Xaa-Ser system radical SAM maturase HxsC [Ferrovum myxofaciens]|uniref:His-Xaa-Ser system radical SAM maturase HxsC n=1 Tax=Ferrovum myxofaciens TaxID=416213 RepID=UPI0023520B12|nr:His-Xaa-Ser system radical SAM maturase HxsC [Ferrovum myxofaciens]QKE39977.1 MAG: His-Xaa-Ser system radical SAM maturase HxsC [Ferrovum myxofaciens]